MIVTAGGDSLLGFCESTAVVLDSVDGVVSEATPLTVGSAAAGSAILACTLALNCAAASLCDC